VTRALAATRGEGPLHAGDGERDSGDLTAAPRSASDSTFATVDGAKSPPGPCRV